MTVETEESAAHTCVLRSDVPARVRTLTLNRVPALNAMNEDMFSALAEALQQAQEDDSVAVVVITGAGRAFCAGLDLAEAGRTSAQAFPQMLQALAHFSKPVLAAVNGLGVGIGMTMLAHCDLVLMADDARLRTPFPQLGLAPEAGSSYTFAQRMGWQNAAYTLMSGRWFSAAECLQMGLAWRLCEASTLLAETHQVAAELAANPIPSLVATKQLMLEAGQAELAWSAHQRELQAYATLMGGPANVEAFAAFREKRAADFSRIAGL